MTPLEEHIDKAMARGGLRDLIREMMGQLPHSEEQKIFDMATQWGDRRATFEREACAREADDEQKSWEEPGSGWAACGAVANRIRNR